MNSAAYRFLTLIAVFSLVCTGVLFGQTAVTGAITGYVSDASGAAVADAEVDATNTGDAVVIPTVTNKDGLYRFTSLIPGTYTITVKKAGFATFTRDVFRVDAGTPVRIDATLPLATVRTAVEVSSQAPILQTDSVEISQNIQTHQVEVLPTFGRNVTQLGLLAPGVAMPSGQLDLHPENAGEDFNVNINGASPNNNSHLLDGVQNTEAIQGYSILVPTQDSVQEFKVTTSNYDAEYGQVGGGVIQITTKSGTNALHGSLFEYYRTAGFNAANPFTEPNGPAGNVWNQFGGSLGGAIKKDKLFFFGDYQGMRNNLSTSSKYTSPIDAFRHGDFSSVAATDPIFDPATGNADGTGRTQFQCDGVLNVICPDRLSAASQNLLALVPEPNIPGALDNNYVISRPATFDQNQGDGRVDYFINSKNVVFGKYSYFKATFYTDNVFGPAGGGPALGGAVNSGNSYTRSQSGMFDYQHTFSSTLLNDFRFALSRLNIQELQLDASNPNAATEAGIPDINLGTIYTAGLPQFDIAGPVSGFTMGDIGLPFFENETNVSFFDNMTKVYGRHTFKFGGGVEKFFGIRSDTSGRGDFQSSNNLTGDPTLDADPNRHTPTGLGLASFLLGLSGQSGGGYSRRITLVEPQEKQWRLGFYGQDTWRVNAQLTLLLGLRWDYASPMFAPDGESLGNLDLNTGNVLLSNLFDKYAGVETRHNEFAPRVGLSYQLNGNTVLRAGFGRSYFLNPYGANFGTQACCWPIKQDQEFSQDTSYTPLPFTFDQGPGLPPTLPPFPSSGQIPLPDQTGQIFPGVGKYPHSYSDGWNLTLEHSFAHDINVSVAYVGSVGRKLWNNSDPNAPVPGPGTLNDNRPYFPIYGWTQGLTLRNNTLPSSYNALQAKFQKHFHNGLYVLSNFTWDKSLDDGTFGVQNQFNIGSNWGNSEFTRPLVSVTAVNWELPIGRGRAFGNDMNGVAQAIAGGWAINGIINLEAGQYFTPTIADTSTNLNSTITLRPDRIGSGSVSNPNRNRWFNPADFVQPAAQFTYGDSGKGILEGPGFASVDLSLAKTLALTERFKLDLRWDVFNAFNRTNLANPNSQVDTSQAGVINGIQYNMRRMQIGAHLQF